MNSFAPFLPNAEQVMPIVFPPADFAPFAAAAQLLKFIKTYPKTSIFGLI